MISFLISTVFFLVLSFFILLLGSLMLWVLVKLLRFLFPGRFSFGQKRKDDVI